MEISKIHKLFLLPLFILLVVILVSGCKNSTGDDIVLNSKVNIVEMQIGQVCELSNLYYTNIEIESLKHICKERRKNNGTTV